MTYFESAENMIITKARAWSEFKAHGATREDFEDFLMDVISEPTTTLDEEGNICGLNAQSALVWLGY